MDESFRAFAIVKAARGSVGAKAGQRGQVEHPSQSAVVTFRATQVTGDSAGILWHRDQSRIGGQAPGSGERRQVAAGDDQEFGPQAGSEAGQRLDDAGIRVVAEAFSDGLVDVFDLPVKLEQPVG